MANGDYAQVMPSMPPHVCVEHYLVEMNGTTDVDIMTKMAHPKVAQASWAEDIGATGHVIESVVGTKKVTVRSSGAITKDAFVTVWGY